MKKIKISEILLNTGQIDGLPKNPRFIRDEKFELLKKSIEEDPEMLELRECIVTPYNNKYVIIAGNMRFRAMKELGYKDIPCKVFTGDLKKIRAISIKDNLNYGQWDFDELNNEWDVEELEFWGINLTNTDDNYFDITGDNEELVDKKPSVSDNEYSSFELIMLYENKLKLLDTLNDVKKRKFLEKHEDALMEIINNYNQNKK